MCGAIILQGPHHLAKKSTTTKPVCVNASSKSFCRVISVTMVYLLGESVFRNLPIVREQQIAVANRAGRALYRNLGLQIKRDLASGLLESARRPYFSIMTHSSSDMLFYDLIYLCSYLLF